MIDKEYIKIAQYIQGVFIMRHDGTIYYMDYSPHEWKKRIIENAMDGEPITPFGLLTLWEALVDIANLQESFDPVNIELCAVRTMELDKYTQDDKVQKRAALIREVLYDHGDNFTQEDAVRTAILRHKRAIYIALDKAITEEVKQQKKKLW